MNTSNFLRRKEWRDEISETEPAQFLSFNIHCSTNTHFRDSRFKFSKNWHISFDLQKNESRSYVRLCEHRSLRNEGWKLEFVACDRCLDEIYLLAQLGFYSKATTRSFSLYNCYGGQLALTSFVGSIPHIRVVTMYIKIFVVQMFLFFSLCDYPFLIFLKLLLNYFKKL